MISKTRTRGLSEVIDFLTEDIDPAEMKVVMSLVRDSRIKRFGTASQRSAKLSFMKVSMARVKKHAAELNKKFGARS